MGLVISILALLVSLTFNLLQLKWRNEQRAERAKEKAEQDRKDQDLAAVQRAKEQAPPEFYRVDGAPGPILISGSRYSAQERDCWGLVTVVNRTQIPIKITPWRLVVAGTECPVRSIFFKLRSDPRRTSERISLRGNDKEDYELHFTFSADRRVAGDGELWLTSDNRPEGFSVSITFR